jgi:hypothetical protein
MGYHQEDLRSRSTGVVGTGASEDLENSESIGSAMARSRRWFNIISDSEETIIRVDLFCFSGANLSDALARPGRTR